MVSQSATECIVGTWSKKNRIYKLQKETTPFSQNIPQDIRTKNFKNSSLISIVVSVILLDVITSRL